MIPVMFFSRARVAVLGMVALLSLAAPARAGSLPHGAEVGLTSGVDVVAFRRLVASRYHVEFRVVLAADIDRDGAASDSRATIPRTATRAREKNITGIISDYRQGIISGADRLARR